MLLEHINEALLPIVIALAETMGILIIAYSLLQCFFAYLMRILHKSNQPLKEDLAEGLATALEFMMGAEILKTIIIPNIHELLVLGLIILLRLVLSLLIHFELSHEEKRHTAHKDSENPAA